MVEKNSIMSLVDCGATGEFINRHYAKSQHFTLVKLAQPIPVYNVDGTANEAGLIMEVVNLILHYKNHSKRTTFAVRGHPVSQDNQLCICQETPNPILAPWPFCVNMSRLEAFPSATFL